MEAERRGASTFYAFDERGDVAQRLSAAGPVTSADVYDGYGRVLAGAQPDPWGFGGQAGYYTDNETGLVLLTHRFYDPAQGRFVTRDPAGYGGGINLYGYTANNPINETDPSGLYAGVDDAVFTIGGALVGVIGQGISDALAGKASGWEDYAGAAVGGAAGGEALLYTGPVLSGAIGGATSSLATQGFKNLSGKQQGVDWRNVLISTGLGAVFGRMTGGEIPGFNVGRGNYNSIFKQMVTKFNKGQIGSVTFNTGIKMFLGRGTDTGLFTGGVGSAFAQYALQTATSQPELAGTGGAAVGSSGCK